MERAERTALVIGATGGIGGETANVLLSRGWKVRALHRNAEAMAKSGDARLEWVKGDATDARSVIAAAKGATAIVHGANPPGYRNWKNLAMPMLASTIAAAREHGARIVFPGTVYNYGPETFGSRAIAEDAPQNPRTKKGAIRVEMENALRDSGVPTILVRAGDFFGPQVKNSWFSQGMVRPGQPVTWMMDPGRNDVGHDWAYVPDVARTFVQLLERAGELPTFARFHFRGHWFARARELAETTRRVAGHPSAPIFPFPWLVARMVAPFNETFREMLEMRYLWRESLELDNAALVRFLGEEPHTDLDAAVRETLRGLGCLDGSPVPSVNSSSPA